MSFCRTKVNLLGLVEVKNLKKKVIESKEIIRDFLVITKPNLVKEPEQTLTTPKQSTLATITLSAAGRSLPEELNQF